MSTYQSTQYCIPYILDLWKWDFKPVNIYKQHENVNLHTESYKLFDLYAVRFAETFTFCVVTEMVECGAIAGYWSAYWNMWTDSSAAHDAGDRAPVSARLHISSSKGGKCFTLLRNGVTVEVVLISASGATVYKRDVHSV